MTKKIQNYVGLNDIQSQNFLAQFLPKGHLFSVKYSSASTLYKLIYCLADYIKQLTSQIYILFLDRDPGQAVDLLPEWEASVGIPNIIPRLSTIAQRQVAVKTLLSKTPVINVKPYAYGTMIVNVNTNVVTATITTGFLLTNQTTVTITNALNSILNGTFAITIVNPTTFTFSIAAIDGIGLIVINTGAVIVTNTGAVIQAGNIMDAANFSFTFTGNLNTTYEQFVFNLTGIVIHILFNTTSTNTFAMTFPIIFGAQYNQALLYFQIYVVGTSLPTSTITLLNTVLARVIPSFSAWNYILVAS